MFDITPYLTRLRARNPLVHNITNYVVAPFQANALSSIGASPIMADEPAEAADMTAIADALVVNIGTLNERTVAAMHASLAAAAAKNIPTVLDPVGVAATPYRRRICAELLAAHRFTVIRANAGEIAWLLRGESGSKGIDAGQQSQQPAELARAAAEKLGCIVAMTGKQDHLSDGQTTIRCDNGHPMMALLVGTGCISSALVGAFTAAHPEQPLEAAAAALAYYGLCGEIAAAQSPAAGSLQTHLLDQLHILQQQLPAERILLTRI